MAVVSRFAPKNYAATAVGLVFLGATWFLTIRRDDTHAADWGLALGGLLERDAIDWPKLLKDAAIALIWALVFAAVFFPPFYFGYRFFWQPSRGFAFKWPSNVFDDVAGQLFVIALPEEAFYRGYLQSALERVWAPKRRILGAELGFGWLVSAAVFAVGHVLTSPSPARLAVFFPALLFGYMRARTKGIGASMVFHAACNIYSATLARGFGLPV